MHSIGGLGGLSTPPARPVNHHALLLPNKNDSNHRRTKSAQTPPSDDSKVCINIHIYLYSF